MFSCFFKDQTLVPTHPVRCSPSIASASGYRFRSPLPKRRQTRPTLNQNYNNKISRYSPELEP